MTNYNKPKEVKEPKSPIIDDRDLYESIYKKLCHNKELFSNKDKKRLKTKDKSLKFFSKF